MIEWALTFHNQWKKQYLDTDVVVEASEGTFNIKATVISPGSFINAQGIRSHTDHFLFLFNVDEVQFKIARGIRFTYNGKVYESIIDRTKSTYDDPIRKVITVPAKLLCS